MSQATDSQFATQELAVIKLLYNRSYKTTTRTYFAVWLYDTA